MDALTIDYSQSGEQDAILALPLTGRSEAALGRFLDVGAGEGEKFSNTRALLDLGWRGVMVEPAAELFDLLVKRFGRNEYVHCVQAVVSAEIPHRSLVQMHYAPGDLVSTTEAEHAAIWAATVEFLPAWAAAVSMSDLLDAFGPFAFASIDTEGSSLDLLAAYRTHPYWEHLAAVCVEVEGAADVLRALEICDGEWSVAAETPNNLIVCRS